MNNIAPEEKLLRLIRGQKAHKKADAPGEKSITAAHAHKGIELKDVLKVKAELKTFAYSLFRRYVSFAYLRKIILIALAGASLYLIICFIYPWVGLYRVKLPLLPQEEKISQQDDELKIGLKPYEYYAEAIRGRRVFGGAASLETNRPASGQVTDSIKDISLIGIILGENPQAAIEDKKMQKTYYVTRGQFIGEFQVEAIQEGKVIINYNGERFELYL